MIESIEELQKFLSGLPDGRSVRLSAVTSSGKVRIEYMLAGLLVQFLLQAEVGRELSESALKEALSRGWLSRGKADKPLWEKHKEQERQALIAALDERTFLGLEDMDVDKLYAELLDDHESEVVREVTAIANSVEQAAAIRTAAESLVARLELPVFTTAAQVAAEVADLKAALSKGWLQRKESNPSQMSKRGGNLAECCDCGECALCREVLLQGESV